MILGYTHMFPCITTISKGKILLTNGEDSVIAEAPFTTEVEAGTQKAGHALEDTIWCDAYANPDNERDIDKLEEWLTADTYEMFLLKTNEQKLLKERT